MSRLLYVLTTARPLETEPLFPVSLERSGEIEVVLIQEATRLNHVPADRVFVLEEDLQPRGGVSPFPRIGYRDLIEKMFAVDRVIRL